MGDEVNEREVKKRGKNIKVNQVALNTLRNWEGEVKKGYATLIGQQCFAGLKSNLFLLSSLLRCFQTPSHKKKERGTFFLLSFFFCLFFVCLLSMKPIYGYTTVEHGGIQVRLVILSVSRKIFVQWRLKCLSTCRFYSPP